MAPGLLTKLVDKARVQGEEGGRMTDRWTNPDILPVLPENRNFNLKSYLGFWYNKRSNAMDCLLTWARIGLQLAFQPCTGRWAPRLSPMDSAPGKLSAP